MDLKLEGKKYWYPINRMVGIAIIIIVTLIILSFLLKPESTFLQTFIAGFIIFIFLLNFFSFMIKREEFQLFQPVELKVVDGPKLELLQKYNIPLRNVVGMYPAMDGIYIVCSKKNLVGKLLHVIVYLWKENTLHSIFTLRDIYVKIVKENTINGPLYVVPVAHMKYTKITNQEIYAIQGEDIFNFNMNQLNGKLPYGADAFTIGNIHYLFILDYQTRFLLENMQLIDIKDFAARHKFPSIENWRDIDGLYAIEDEVVVEVASKHFSLYKRNPTYYIHNNTFTLQKDQYKTPTSHELVILDELSNLSSDSDIFDINVCPIPQKIGETYFADLKIYNRKGLLLKFHIIEKLVVPVLKNRYLLFTLSKTQLIDYFIPFSYYYSYFMKRAQFLAIFDLRTYTLQLLDIKIDKKYHSINWINNSLIITSNATIDVYDLPLID